MQQISQDPAFWEIMDQVATATPIIVDGARGSVHPRYPDLTYPLDYGYLTDTSASDGGGIDVWLGSLETKTLTGILCVFDTLKRDMEIKLLVACTGDEIQIIKQFHRDMHVLYIHNPRAER